MLTPPTLKPHQKNIIDYLQRNGRISPREFSLVTSRSVQEIRLDFDKLVTLGLIEPMGFGEGIYYVLI
jgi:DeoR/GlpR family transcriptional regulator of sugar metabolism